MAAIFPESGVPASQAQNTVNVDTTNCDSGELFHSTTRCQPRFDPAAANAVMSEILNLVAGDGTGDGAQGAGRTYDCNRLDNMRLAVRDFVRAVIEEGCYTLDNLGTNCGQRADEVRWINDGGCGRLVRVDQDPLPRGLDVYAQSVNGRFLTTFTGNPADRSARIEANSMPSPDHHSYEVIPPAIRVLRAADFCGLRVAGTRLQLDVRTNFNYFLNLAVRTGNQGSAVGPYQWGVALFVDGNFVQATPDRYLMGRHEDNHFLADFQDAIITTTGGDITIELVPFVQINTSINPEYTPGDSIEVDMAQLGVRYETLP